MKSKKNRRPLHRVGSSAWIDDVLTCIPTNWCDPLLTGPTATLKGKGGTWGCPDIERLLNAVREQLRTKLKSSTKSSRTAENRNEAYKEPQALTGSPTIEAQRR